MDSALPAYLRPTQASVARNAVRRPPSSSEPSSKLAPSTVPKTSPRGAKITDTDFRSAVLGRYGIAIEHVAIVQTPYQHFHTPDPAENGYAGSIENWYRQKHPHCNIWLSLDDDLAAQCSEQYKILSSISAREAKFSHRAKQYFFREDDTYSPDDNTRCSSTYFELEWAPSPDDRLLRSPPVLKPSIIQPRPFSFNTNPDCTYWLTVRRLNEVYRNSVERVAYVLPEAQVTSPYLTIEFKKDYQSIVEAENQLAAATALILYNRVLLRSKRLRATGSMPTSWSLRQFRDIKHYGIALAQCKASFYEVRPILSFNPDEVEDPSYPWRGCTLSQFTSENAASKEGFLRIQRWVNEIHHWGLSIHSQNVIADVKGVLLERSGLGTISMTPLELEALNKFHGPIGDGGDAEGDDPAHSL